MSAYPDLLTSPTFEPGDHVRVGRNDAKVPVGNVGIVWGIAPETGNPIVDFPGRGRVAITPDSLTLHRESPLPASSTPRGVMKDLSAPEIAARGSPRPDGVPFLTAAEPPPVAGDAPPSAAAPPNGAVAGPKRRRPMSDATKQRISDAHRRRHAPNGDPPSPRAVTEPTPIATTPAPANAGTELRSGADRDAIRTVIGLAATRGLSSPTLLQLVEQDPLPSLPPPGGGVSP